MEQVGSISAVCGRVTAVDINGQARQLRLHDPVFCDDMLIAALDSAANVRLVSGTELYVAPGTTAVLNADVFEHDESADDGSLCFSDVQHALDLLQPPARRSVA